MADGKRILVVIPSRFGSTRFPGKSLALLSGRDGVAKPLIQWTWECAAMQRHGDVVVATDDARIAEVVTGFGGKVVMTSVGAANGTARCAEVAASIDVDLIINLQGDSPLIPAHFVDALIDAWRVSHAPVLTAYVACDAELERRLVTDAAAGRVGGTTMVVNAASQALYFSKSVIPHRNAGQPPLKLHVGLYAYTPAALAAYAAHPASALELAEGLEQLRFLDMGCAIEAVCVPAPASGLWEVNNPEDVALVERGLEARGLSPVLGPHARQQADYPGSIGV